MLQPGAHFSNDLSEPDTVNPANESYNSKRIVHLISRQLTIVGVLKKQDLQMLYEAYPEWKQKMRHLNHIMHGMAKSSLQKYIAADGRQDDTVENHLKIIENHVTYSTDINYQTILDIMEAWEEDEGGSMIIKTENCMLEKLKSSMNTDLADLVMGQKKIKHKHMKNRRLQKLVTRVFKSN